MCKGSLSVNLARIVKILAISRACAFLVNSFAHGLSIRDMCLEVL
jgi:hypothetical protein